MPECTDGVRGGSTKRRYTLSDEAKDQELSSSNSLDLSHSKTEGPQNPATVLASPYGAL